MGKVPGEKKEVRGKCTTTFKESLDQTKLRNSESKDLLNTDV